MVLRHAIQAAFPTPIRHRNAQGFSDSSKSVHVPELLRDAARFVHLREGFPPAELPGKTILSLGFLEENYIP